MALLLPTNALHSLLSVITVIMLLCVEGIQGIMTTTDLVTAIALAMLFVMVWLFGVLIVFLIWWEIAHRWRRWRDRDGNDQ